MTATYLLDQARPDGAYDIDDANQEPPSEPDFDDSTTYGADHNYGNWSSDWRDWGEYASEDNRDAGLFAYEDAMAT